MAIKNLSERERAVILQCLLAVSRAGLVDASEFRTVLGVSPAQLEEVISDWPSVDDSTPDSVGYLAINNSMVLVAYDARSPRGEWSGWFDVSRDEIGRIFRKWKRPDDAGAPGGLASG